MQIIPLCLMAEVKSVQTLGGERWGCLAPDGGELSLPLQVPALDVLGLPTCAKPSL